MINENLIKQAYSEGGIKGLSELFDKLPKEEAIKGFGILSIVAVAIGISKCAIDVIKEIVLHK